MSTKHWKSIWSWQHCQLLRVSQSQQPIWPEAAVITHTHTHTHTASPTPSLSITAAYLSANSSHCVSYSESLNKKSLPWTDRLLAAAVRLGESAGRVHLSSSSVTLTYNPAIWASVTYINGFFFKTSRWKVTHSTHLSARGLLGQMRNVTLGSSLAVIVKTLLKVDML